MSERPSAEQETGSMIGWAITLLMIALVAGFFGFGLIATAAVEIAKLLFFIFIVLFVIGAVFSRTGDRSPRA